MTTFILKLNQDEKLYVLWSTNSDWYLNLGTREDMIRLLTRPVGNYCRSTSLQVMKRVDETGTSDSDGRCSWDDPTPINVGEQAPGDGWYHISRCDLPKLVAASEVNDTRAMHSLMRRYA